MSIQWSFADPIPTGLQITGNNYGRAVSGSEHEVGFTLNNHDNESISFTLEAFGNALGSEPVGFGGVGSPISGATPGVPTQQPYSFLADTSGVAGTSISVGMTATEKNSGTRTATKSFDLQLLENRTIGFSLERKNGSVVSSEGVLDLGRFIGNSVVTISNSETGVFTPYATFNNNQELNLNFNGGAKTHDVATDVGWNPALLNAYGVSIKDTNGIDSGMHYYTNYPSSNAETKDFKAENISHTLGTYFTSNVGAFSKTIDFASAGNLAAGFTPESVSGVAISGAEVQFADSQFTIQGNNLSNRTIFATAGTGNGLTTNGVNTYEYRSNTAAKGGLFDTDAVKEGIQGRVMVGSSGNIAAGSDTWTLSSSGLDDATARVNFTGSGILTSTSGLLSVDTGSAETVTAFNGTSTRTVGASWGGISYGTAQGVGINTSQKGVITSSVNLTANLSSGEQSGDLSGQTMGNLGVGYSLEVVADRIVTVKPNISLKAFNNISVSGLMYNDIRGSVGAYTNPTITNQEAFSQKITNTSEIRDVISSDMGTTGSGSGARTLTVTPEGLAGERAQYDLSYNWSLSRVGKAIVAVSGDMAGAETGSTLQDRSFTRDVNELGIQSLGSFSLSQTNAGSGVANAQIWSSGGYSSKGFSSDSTTSNSGRAETLNFSFDDTGLKNGTYFSSMQVNAQHADQNIIGAGMYDLGSYQVLVEVEVSGRGDNTGYKGFRMTKFDTTSAQVSEGDTSLEILAIIGGTGERGVSMEILGEGTVAGPNGESVGFTSGTVDGLQGVKFVLQSSYDENELVNTFGTESVAALLWKNERGEFVNAVLGNTSDAENGGLEGQAKVGQRYVGSYASYLTTLGTGVARLGDFGYDTDANKVWAVLDHNSTFGGAGAVAAGVPEPSSLAMLLMAGAIAFRRRRA